MAQRMVLGKRRPVGWAFGFTLLAFLLLVLPGSAAAEPLARVQMERQLAEVSGAEPHPTYYSSSSAPEEARYIVVLKDSIKHPGAVAEDQAEEVEGEVDLVYRSALKGYSATLPKDEVDSLEEDPRVKYVTPDHKVKVNSQTVPTGIERMGAKGNEAIEIDGKDNMRVDVDVAVIDTGIDYKHPDLNVVGRTNCVPADGDLETAECIDDSGQDGHSHGTHVAGTIAALDNGEGVVGVAPGARLWAVKVLADNGVGYTSWIIAGIDWVTAHAAQIEVANMSLGCVCSDPAMDEAIEASAEAGVVYALAAGNSAIDAKYFSPAGNPDAITVSALADYDGKSGGKGSPSCNNYGPDDTLANFSNFGAEVNVAAPGACILSTRSGGGYLTLSGTSMASPHVAGAAALLASKENPQDLEDVEAIRETLEEEGNSEWTDNSGDGTKEPLLDTGDKAVFSPADLVALTDTPSAVSASEETLRAKVNPGGLATEYQFEYGTTTSYGSKAPASPQSAGSGGEYTPVSETVKGLSGKTLYHYRVLATNSKGTFYGADRIFATTPPVVTSGSASVLSANAAELTATVNPEGLATTYGFEYGTDTSYGHKAALGEPSAGSGTSPVGVSSDVGVLHAKTTYHYRVFATNVAGTAYGVDKTFTTGTADWHADVAPDKEPETVTNGAYNDVSCSSSSSCMAVGSHLQWPEGEPNDVEEALLASHWDGKSWQDVTLPEGLYQEYLTSVSCPSASACVTVGVYNSGLITKSVIDRWDGESWQRDKAAMSLVGEGSTSRWLLDASCASATHCVAVGFQRVEGVGGSPRALVLDGEEWSWQEVPMPAGAVKGSLGSISCTSAEACIAVGWYATNEKVERQLVASFDGEAWSSLSEGEGKDPEMNLNQVSCWGGSLASVECMAMGGAIGGARFVRRYDGEEWTTEVPPSPPGGLFASWRGLTCSGAEDCTLTGMYFLEFEAQAFVQHWDGSEWSFETTDFPTAGSVYDELYAVACPAAWCVGAGAFSENLFEGDSRPLIESNFTPDPRFSFAFGTPGSGNGQLSYPSGVAIDSSGNAWVVDGENNRIQKFNSKGEYQSQFGSEGEGNGQLSSLEGGIAIDSSGNVWVADTGNNRIQKFNSKGEYVSKFGTGGSGNGQLNEPTDLAIDSSGNVWVADWGNHRIQKFNSSGAYQSQFGTKGSGNGQLDSPLGIAIDSSGNIWVADSENNRIQKFNSSGEYQSQFGTKGSGNGQLNTPMDVAIDSLGNIWVADGLDRIEKFNSKGEYLSQFGAHGSGAGQFDGVGHIAIDSSGNVWAPDLGNDRVEVWRTGQPVVSGESASEVSSESASLNATIDPEGLETTYRFEYGTTTSYGTNVPVPDASVGSGNEGVEVGKSITGLKPSTTYHFRVVATNAEGITTGIDHTFTTKPDPRFSFAFGSEGSGNGQFAYPAGVAVDSSGNAWVVDSENNRIQKFNSKGEYQSKFGSEGSGNGQFSYPEGGLAIDSSGNVWVADTYNNRIQKFNSKGEYLSKFGTYGSGNGQFKEPTDVAIDSSGNVWVADWGNNRIQKFNSSGTYQSQFGTKGSGNGQLDHPQGLSIDGSGNVWVADSENNRIQKFNSSGTYQSQFGTKGSGNGQLNEPVDIAIDSSGNIWVTDSGNNRIQKFNSSGTYQSKFGAYGSAAGQFDGVGHLAIDSSGNVWVPDLLNDRVEVWKP